MSYVQRPQAAVVQENEYSTISRFDDQNQSAVAAIPAGAGCFSSTTSLMPIDNPDLIRDTRRGSAEDIAPYGVADYGHVEAIDDAGKMLYSSCLWEARDTCGRTSAVTVGAYPSKEQLAVVAPVVEQFPPGAKQMRVWQKGVPVLPPVSALKRVLGSTRSSPDEGYQEGTGTDV